MRQALVLAVFAVFPSCSSAAPIHVEPGHASMFGDVDVTISGDFESLGTIREVTIGGVRALDVRASARTITVRLQGSPSAGPAEIRIEGDEGARSDASAFSFDAPSVPVKWMAFGASLTHGMQSAGLDARGQLHGYAAQVARAAGVFLAPPLVVDGLLPPMRASDFVSDCAHTYDAGALVGALFSRVTDPMTQAIDMRRGRLDPTLATRNPAVGGSKLRDVISGMVGPGHALEKIGELPDGDPGSLWAATTHPQLERIRLVDPDVAISGDLLANDVMPTLGADDLDPTAATDPAVIDMQLETILDTIGALHGQYFIANLLDVTFVPSVADLRKRRIAAGQDTEQSFDAKRAAIRATVSAYNDALVRVAAGHPNIHVIDFAGEGSKVLENGVDVAGRHLTGDKFGGLLSLDHLHFSDTGYAVMANMFIRAINAASGTHIPEVDVEAVHQDDPFSPENLAKQGVHCAK